MIALEIMVLAGLVQLPRTRLDLSLVSLEILSTHCSALTTVVWKCYLAFLTLTKCSSILLTGHAQKRWASYPSSRQRNPDLRPVAQMPGGIAPKALEEVEVSKPPVLEECDSFVGASTWAE
jgi:hypothetical protein